MQLSWRDVDFTEEPGEFPFADGLAVIGHKTIAEWLSFPEAVFTVSPTFKGGRRRIRYLVGERAS